MNFVVLICAISFIVFGIIFCTKMDKKIKLRNDLRNDRLREKRIVIFEKNKIQKTLK